MKDNGYVQSSEVICHGDIRLFVIDSKVPITMATESKRILHIGYRE